MVKIEERTEMVMEFDIAAILMKISILVHELFDRATRYVSYYYLGMKALANTGIA